MLRRMPPQQLDLFDPPCAAGSLPTPQWRSLPDEARLAKMILAGKSSAEALGPIKDELCLPPKHQVSEAS